LTQIGLRQIIFQRPLCVLQIDAGILRLNHDGIRRIDGGDDRLLNRIDDLAWLCMVGARDKRKMAPISIDIRFIFSLL